MGQKLSNEKLTADLAKLKEIIRALRNHEVDAIVGTKNILMLRIREAEEELQKQKEFLEQLVLERTKLVENLKIHQVELETQAEELRQAHTEVEEVRDRYLDLYDFAPVGYFTIDEHSRIVEANLTASKLLKMATRRNLLKTHFTKYISPEESDRFHFYQRKLLESGKKQSLELKMQKTDGTVFNAQLISVKAGFGMLRIAVIDITGLKRFEHALKASEEKYRGIVETANEGILIGTVNGIITFCNSRMADLLGYSMKEIIGKSGLDFMEDGQEGIVLQSRKELSNDKTLEREYKFRRKDGSILWTLASVSPQFDIDGHHIANLAMHTDITERKEIEEELIKSKEDLENRVLARTEELRKSEEDYRRVIETANEGVWNTDPNGNVIFVNDKITEMIGYSKEEIIGRNGLDFLAVEQRELILRMRRDLDKGLRISEELQFCHKNGSPVWVLANASPLFENKVHTRNLYMMTDITERKKTEDEIKDVPRRILQAQEKERQNIGRELHDEVGQSLTYLALLLDRMTRVPPESIGSIIAETRQLNSKVLGQVRNLLLNLQPGTLENLGLIVTLDQYFTDYTNKTGIEVDASFTGNWDKLDYDLSLVIYRICQEALTNIARYAEVSEASVRLQKDTNMIILQIEDEGTGFDVTYTRKDSAGLIGMRERTRMLGGVLEIESAPGQGTRIHVEIPLKT
jgi:PAS domain S-box-containing protein